MGVYLLPYTIRWTRLELDSIGMQGWRKHHMIKWEVMAKLREFGLHRYQIDEPMPAFKMDCKTGER
jgi:hypothetical protein